MSNHRSYLRDIGKIVQCKAFRRLAHKTQVFNNHETDNDHCRTRLTHTIEVAHTGRLFARRVGANEELTEALCLAHDLGHSPFGHAGEIALNELVPGGFNHNIQTFRILTEVENLGVSDAISDVFKANNLEYRNSTEAEIMRLADDVTYIAHDIDDGLRNGLLSFDLLEEIKEWRKAREITWPQKETKENILPKLRTTLAYASLEDVKRIKGFLYSHLYETENKLKIVEETKKVIYTLWEHFEERADRLDYIAGMTDRFAWRTYERILSKNA